MKKEQNDFTQIKSATTYKTYPTFYGCKNTMDTRENRNFAT